MNVLVIDTSTEIFGLGLLTVDGRWYETVRKAGLKHAEIVMVAVDDTLRAAGLSPGDLELVVCSRGPGSFTGLRIGMATAKGIAAGAGIPVVSVPSLDAMAYRYRWFAGTVMPVIDARKKHVYTGLFSNGVCTSGHLDISVAEALRLIPDTLPLLITGPGASMLEARQEGAAYTCEPGGWNYEYTILGIEKLERVGPDASDAGPEYLRKSDAEINLEGRISGTDKSD